jgi:hypothetical protein
MGNGKWMALLLVASAGCDNLSDLGRGTDAGGTKDSGAMPNEAAADTGADAPADVMVDAGPPFCSTVDAMFCADFDEGNLVLAWPASETWSSPISSLGTLALDPSKFRSPPDSFRSSTVVSDASVFSSTFAQLYKNFTTMPASVHIEFDAYLGPPPSDYVDFLRLALSTPNCTYYLHLRGQNDGLGNVALEEVEDHCGVAFATQPFTSIVVAGKWEHFTIDCTFPSPDAGSPDGSAGSGTLSVGAGSLDGGLIFQGPITPTVGSPFIVYVGIMGGLFGQNDSPWTANYDNVVIDFH